MSDSRGHALLEGLAGEGGVCLHPLPVAAANATADATAAFLVRAAAVRGLLRLFFRLTGVLDGDGGRTGSGPEMKLTCSVVYKRHRGIETTRTHFMKHLLIRLQ